MSSKINYKNKYLKYKKKYLEYKNGGNTQKYAIVMLCMLKDHYVLGACISSYAHRQFIKNTNMNIELVIMCDDYIFDLHESTLKEYFDKVIKIDLLKFDISDEYKVISKYNWINVSTNKWQVLKFIEYDKVLFLDIDMIPVNAKFYNIFDFDVPAVRYIKHYSNDIIDTGCINNSVLNDNIEKYDDFSNYIKSVKPESLDGGIVLLKPNIEMYEEYVDFIKKTFAKGMYSTHKSGSDETTLYYFLTHEKDVKVHKICTEYAVVPWDVPANDPNKYIENALLYNYLSYVKPWYKPLFFEWDEEMLWRDIYDAMPHRGNIEVLFKTVLVESYDNAMILKNAKNFNFKKRYNMKLYYKNANAIDRINSITNFNEKYNAIINLENKLRVGHNYGIINVSKLLDVLKI